MAALTTTLAVAALGLAAGQTAHAMMQKPPKAPAAPDASTLLTSAPKVDPAADARAAERAAASARGRQGTRQGRTSTILTGASGLTSEAPTQRKTLLGL